MILPQPDVDATNEIINTLKCDVATLYSNKAVEEDYFIKLCKTSLLDGSFEQTVKEKRLLIYLLENIRFLNKVNEYGKNIINCDLNKIYNLQ